MRLAVLAAVLVMGCAASGPPRPSPAPVLAQNVRAFNCTNEEIQAEWTSNRRVSPRVGDRVCTALGRFGDPSHVSYTRTEYFDSVSLIWQYRRRTVAVIGYYYPRNSPSLKYNGKPAEVWTIEIVTTS